MNILALGPRDSSEHSQMMRTIPCTLLTDMYYPSNPAKFSHEGSFFITEIQKLHLVVLCQKLPNIVR
jgi:hypothetical protein